MLEILLADSISKSYGSRRVLSSARLRATAESITFVAGRNGSGKSTLLRICAGTLGADTGVVTFAGRLSQRPRLADLARRGLFYLPDRDILSTRRSVRTHLEALRSRFGGGVAIHDVAESLRILHCLDRPAPKLSGGERRRAEVALAVVRQPACLIADEPLRGIDPRDRSDILAALRGLADTGCAVVVSGHETTDLLEAADAVTWVTSGTTYELGDGAQALRTERFRRDYLTGRWSVA